MKWKNLPERILEAALLIAIAVYLLRMAVQWILEVWWILAVIAAIVVMGVALYRIWKHRNDTRM